MKVVLPFLIFVLVADTVLLIYSLFFQESESKDTLTKFTATLTAVLFWFSEYCSQSKYEANGVIDFFRFVLDKLEQEAKNKPEDKKNIVESN
jgi:hypothetical protein